MEYKYKPGDKVLLRSTDDITEAELKKYAATSPSLRTLLGKEVTIKERGCSFKDYPTYYIEESSLLLNWEYFWCEPLFVGLVDEVHKVPFDDKEYSALMNF